jgi:uncharacterized protein YndB with AHSA1/START domain/catechol 2,3-dioxygenase-like lactoylglutathione lyase family enzyme
MTEAATTQEITITRVFDAPRQLVWDAWTQPDQLATWWGKRGWTTDPSTIVMELRPGGTFRLTSVSDDDGAEMPQEGVYREVVEPERLVIDEVGEGNWHEGATSVVTFTDLGGGRTEMTFRSTIQTTEDMRAHAETGVASSFERLAEHLAEVGGMDFLLEVVQVPVSDVDRAKAFYTENAGFKLDHDTWHGELRVVQLTPPGSACSIVFGVGLSEMKPGSLDGLQLVVADIRAARAALLRRGLDVGDVQIAGAHGFREAREGEELDNVGFAFFSDPDGNRWAMQQISARGRS